MPNPPRSVDFAVACIVLAVLAGAVETLLRPVGLGGLVTRACSYGVVLWLCVLTFRGTALARTLLAGGLATIGLASLTIEPIAAALSANGDMFSGIGVVDVVRGSIRTLHIGAVIAALIR